MGLTGEIKLDVLGYRTSFHLDLIEKVRMVDTVWVPHPRAFLDVYFKYVNVKSQKQAKTSL